jgi:hypothetical protein
VRYRLAHPKRISDSEHYVAHLYVAAVSQGDCGKVLDVNLDYGDITPWIKSNNFSFERASIL